MKPTWFNDNISLYHGDCLEVMKQLPANSINTVITDPPYDIEIGSAFVKAGGAIIDNGSGGFNTGDTWSWLNDTAWLKLGSNLAIFHKMGDTITTNPVIKQWHRFYLVKKNPPPTPRSVFQSAVEECSIFFKQGEKRGWFGGQTPNYILTNVHDATRNEFDHPSIKPLKAIQTLVRCLSDTGYTVIDPFMGSGTTGVACVKLGRKFIGIEKEEKYFDMAIERINRAIGRPENKKLKKGLLH